MQQAIATLTFGSVNQSPKSATLISHSALLTNPTNQRIITLMRYENDQAKERVRRHNFLE
jgi:hypothetical protein